MKACSTHILQCLFVFILFPWAAHVQAQPAAAVPDPSPALVLIPEAAKVGPPAWVGKFTRLDYRGVQSTAVAGAGQVDQRVEVAITPKARDDGWLRATNNFTVQSLAGMPPDQSQSEGSGGPASIGGQWIGPDAIPKLKARQLIDRNDITKTVISVSDVNPRSVTISEVGQRHRIDWTYDAATGILAGVKTTTTLGLGQITYRVQLVGQR